MDMLYCNWDQDEYIQQIMGAAVQTPENNSAQGMEENLKKAVTEMLVLALLSQEDMHSAQIMQTLAERSENRLSIVFPYAVLYRLIDRGYIWEAYKKIAPDGRRRQYYQITTQGRDHLAALNTIYRRFIGGVDLLLRGEEGQTDAE